MIIELVRVASAMSNQQNLNEEQQRAVQMTEGPVLVLAGAGSGKTRVVTTRIVRLIEEGVPPSKILGLTFTNKAAGQMRDRVQKLTEQNVLISTFHSLGARILRETIHVLGYKGNFTIYDEEDVLKLIKSCMQELNIKEKVEAKSFRYLITNAKNNLLDFDEVETGHFKSIIEELFPQVYELYQKKLRAYQAVDFDDLLFLVVKLWDQHPEILAKYQERWAFLLVDEYQDTNAAQYMMTRLIVERHKNLFVVGDPDQSIYSWRGANVQNILNFEKDYPGATVIWLEQNYRSTMNILQAANALIQKNTNRYEKELWSELGEGEKIKLFVGENERSEAQFVVSQVDFHHSNGISLNDIAIFYRTNAQSRAFEDYLVLHKIPYVIVGGISFYQRREIKDILAFLRISQSSADFISFARTINLPKRGLGDTTIEKIRHHAAHEGLTILRYCECLVNNEPLQHPLKLTAKQKSGLESYIQIVHSLREVSKEGSIKSLVIAAIEETGYVDYLSEDEETKQDREENLNELIAKAAEWETSVSNPSLESFLEDLSLKSSLDEADQTYERLSLMTIHNGKGLEFTVTFLVGLEENLFPHVNSNDDAKELEEERRLCYVGMTRAKEFLYLSYCRSRFLWGSQRSQYQSRFIKEIPQKYLEKFSFQPKISYNKSEKVVNLPNFITSQSYSHSQIESEKKEIFAPGDRLFHNEFGIGIVREAFDGSMGLTYKIYFDKDQSLKTLVSKFAPLKRL